MPGEQALDHGVVQQLLGADGFLDGVRQEQLHGDGHITEREVEVDEADLAGAVVGEREREVHGCGGLAHPALRGKDRDDVAGGCARRTPVQRQPELLGARDRIDHARVVLESDDVPAAGLHGAVEHIGLEVRPDQDHAGGGAGVDAAPR